jgi:lysophospholipase L1-like esterase
VHAACGGAKTGDVINTQSANLTSTTNWVTYTIGGNDAGFSSVITECAQPSWSSNCDGAIDTAQSYITNTLPGRLDLVNNKIKSLSPSAKVIVLDYPHRTKLREAATRAGANFVFKDAIPPFVGHAVCDSPEWLNGLSNPTSESYHPNRTGHSSGYTPLVRAVLG